MISQTDALFLHLTKTLLLFLFLDVSQFSLAQKEPDLPDMRSWSIRSNDATDRYIFEIQGHRKQKRHLYLGWRE